MKKTANTLFKIIFGLFILSIPWQTRWIFFAWSEQGRLWEYGRLGLYGSMILLALAVIFFIFNNRKELHFSKHKFLYFVFAYSIIIGFLSPIPIVSFFYLLVIYLAILFAHLARFIPKFFILRLFLLSGLIQAVLAIQQALGQGIGANKWLGLAEHLPGTLGTAVVEFADLRILRAYGALPHPNILGGFLFVAIFIGIYLWLHLYRQAKEDHWSKKFLKKHVWELLFVIFSLSICTVGLLATFSRSAVLGLAAGLLSVFLINIFKRDWIVVNVIVKYVAVFILAMLAFNLWFPGAWTARLNIDGRLEQQSIQQRAQTYQQFYMGDWKQVLFGQGMGMNTQVAYQQNQAQPIYTVQPIHNVFMLALAEVGLIGALILLNIVRLVIKEADKVDIMATSLLLGLIVIGLFDHYLWTTWTGWLLVAFGLVNLYKTKLKT